MYTNRANANYSMQLFPADGSAMQQQSGSTNINAAVVWFSAPAPSRIAIQSTDNVQTGLFGLELNGQRIFDNNKTNLNFPTGTDMSFLESGDKVSQGSTAGSDTWSDFLTAVVGTVTNRENAFDGDPNTVALPFDTGGGLKWTTPFVGMLADSKIKIKVWLPNQGYSFFVNASLGGSATISLTSDADGVIEYDLADYAALPSSQPIQNIAIVAENSAQTQWGAIWVNGQIVVDGEGFPTINASGTVSDVSGTTATLSSSTGTWTNGENVTGPEKQNVVVDDATKYLQFKEDGTVESLISGPMDPPYTTQNFTPNLTLTFPGTFPSGNTPDEELGEGTKLIVDVTASNQYGSETKSAEVQPSTIDGPALGGMTTLYTGNGASQDIVSGVDLANNGGMVWIKNRTSTLSHHLYDTMRGAAKPVFSDSNSQEASISGGLTAFNENGFTLGDSTGVNASSSQNVAWTFEKREKYFDIVKYTGSGTSSFQNIPHNLGAQPGCIMVKDLTGANSWAVYHTSLGQLFVLQLNKSDAAIQEVHWNNTRPTSTQFTVGPQSMTNDSGHNYIAYLFAEDSDFIKCGTYDGDGTTSNRIEVGFEPQWLMFKRTDGTGQWVIADSKRGMTGVNDSTLYADTSGAEDQNTNVCSTDATGFTLTNGWVWINDASSSYVYIAIAKPPTRSLTQEEFAEQALKFATYQNRKEVQCGKMAESQRDELIKAMAEKGYDLDDILKYL